MDEIRGVRNKGSRVELGPDRKVGSRQTMVFLGVGLMCEHARRGLSKQATDIDLVHLK